MHNPMPRLRAAIVADHGVNVAVASEEIDNRSLTRITKSEIDGEKCVLSRHG